VTTLPYPAGCASLSARLACSARISCNGAIAQIVLSSYMLRRTPESRHGRWRRRSGLPSALLRETSTGIRTTACCRSPRTAYPGSCAPIGCPSLTASLRRRRVRDAARNIDHHRRLAKPAGAGLRISEALAFHTGCLRGDFIRVRWQISAKANREDCKTRLVPLKHRREGEYRDVPVAPFIVKECHGHEAMWRPIPLEFQDKAGRPRVVEVFFAPRDRGKGVMPTATTYAYHFRKAQIAAGIAKPDGTAKYPPHSLRHFFASTALANGVPIHEVSRWLGHKSIKTTVDIYGHLVPEAWDRCRDVMQNAMRPAVTDSQESASAA